MYGFTESCYEVWIQEYAVVQYRPTPTQLQPPHAVQVSGILAQGTLPATNGAPTAYHESRRPICAEAVGMVLPTDDEPKQVSLKRGSPIFRSIA